MTSYDFSPLFSSSIGFDRFARLMDSTLQTNTSGTGYPPYNIAAVGEDHYRITIAVAGYSEKDLNIEVSQQILSVSGKTKETEEGAHYLYRGISEQNFARKFQLADHVNVADARLVDGLLTIDLERVVPEELKPRTIKIEHGSPKSLTDKAKKMIEGTIKGKAA